MMNFCKPSNLIRCIFGVLFVFILLTQSCALNHAASLSNFEKMDSVYCGRLMRPDSDTVKIKAISIPESLSIHVLYDSFSISLNYFAIVAVAEKLYHCKNSPKSKVVLDRMLSEKSNKPKQIVIFSNPLTITDHEIFDAITFTLLEDGACVSIKNSAECLPTNIIRWRVGEPGEMAGYSRIESGPHNLFSVMDWIN